MSTALATLINPGSNDGLAVETVVATSNVKVQTQPNTTRVTKNPAVVVRGILAILPGTGATQLTVRCRHNNAAGLDFQGWGPVIPVTPGVLNTVALNFLDTTGISEQVGGVNYVLTTVVNGETVAGTVLVSAVVEVLDPTP